MLCLLFQVVHHGLPASGQPRLAVLPWTTGTHLQEAQQLWVIATICKKDSTCAARQLTPVDGMASDAQAVACPHMLTATAGWCPLQEHYLQIYVDSPHFPQPCPVPEMAGLDPLQMQLERQQRARAEQERQGLLASPTASKPI